MKQFLQDVPVLKLFPFYEKKFNQLVFCWSLMTSYVICTFIFIVFDSNKHPNNLFGVPTLWYPLTGVILISMIWSFILMKQILRRYYALEFPKLEAQRRAAREREKYLSTLYDLKNKEE